MTGSTSTSRPQDADLRIGGEPDGADPRAEAWLRAFILLGIGLRLVRLGLDYPLWRDEAYVAANLLERNFAGLSKPLEYQQVCPVLFLWAEKAVSETLGFGAWSLRLLPTVAAIASLFLFRHLAGRLLKGVAPAIAVAILAIGYTPIRHGGEIKPYATDFLMALGLINLAVEWLRARQRTGFLWALILVGPLGVAFSNPSIFVATSVGLVLAIPVLRSRSFGVIAPFIMFGLLTVGTFVVLLWRVNGPQSSSVMPWMRVYWASAFPPHSFLPLLAWLVRTHTSHMFAYPAGGDAGASSLSTGLVAAAIVAFLRRGSKTVLALLLAPFVLGLIAAFLGRYPYGGSARTMQYVAPAIILMAGLGAAVLLARLPRPEWRERAPRLVLVALFAVGIGMMGWDVAHPYKEPSDRSSRDFARRFWTDESVGAELICARTDLRLPLDRLVWQGDRAALYLCHQAIYSERHHARSLPRFDRLSASHPLRVVVFNPTPEDVAVMARWVSANAGRFAFRFRREHVLNPGMMRGRASCEEHYAVYEFTPVASRSPGPGLNGEDRAEIRPAASDPGVDGRARQVVQCPPRFAPHGRLTEFVP
jgi:hypothetical protein